MSVTRTRLAPAARREQLLDLGREMVSQGAPRRRLDRQHRRAGRHLARAALPLLPEQAGVPPRRAAPDGRRDPRGHRPQADGRSRWSSWPSASRRTSTSSPTTTRPTSRSCGARPAGDEDFQRDPRAGPARPDRPDLHHRRTRRSWPRSGLVDTPVMRLVVRGWSALVEEMLLTWLERPQGISRETLLEVMANALHRSRCGCQSDKIASSCGLHLRVPLRVPLRGRRRLQPARGRRSVGPPDQARAGALQGPLGPARGVRRRERGRRQGGPPRAQGGDRPRRGAPPLRPPRRLLRPQARPPAPGRVDVLLDARRRPTPRRWPPTTPPTCRWWPVAEALSAKRLAFDHATIVADAYDALGRAMETTTLAASLLGEEFTIAAAACRLRGGVGTRAGPGQLPAQGARHPGLRRRQRVAHLRLARPARHALHARRGRRDLAADVAPARPLTRAASPTRSPTRRLGRPCLRPRPPARRSAVPAGGAVAAARGPARAGGPPERVGRRPRHRGAVHRRRGRDPRRGGAGGHLPRGAAGQRAARRDRRRRSATTRS